MTLSFCPFLPGPQGKPTCAQSLSKSLLKVDAWYFCSLLFIACKQFSKAPLFLLSPKEQVIFQTSQGIFIYHPFPTPPNQHNLKDKPLCGLGFLDNTITLFIWDSFPVILVSESENFCWSCPSVLVDAIAPKLCCKIDISLSSNWLEWGFQPLPDLLGGHQHLNAKCRGVGRWQLHFQAKLKTNPFI